MIEVSVLSGKRDVALLKRCIESFTSHYSHPIFFRILSDGTLCDAVDIPSINGSFEILPQRHLLSAAYKAIGAHRRVKDAFEQSIVFRKLIYSRVASSGNRINYSDSDIIAIRRCSGLFEAQAKNYFMDNSSSMISVHWRNASLLGNVPVAASVNCGLLSVDKDLIDLELMEWALGLPRISNGSKFHLEQMMWSVLAGSRIQDVFLYNPEQVCFPDRTALERSSTAVLHFTQPNRRNIEKYGSRQRDGYVEIGARRAMLLTPISFLRERASAKAGRLLRKLR